MLRETHPASTNCYRASVSNGMAFETEAMFTYLQPDGATQPIALQVAIENRGDINVAGAL